MPTKCRQAVLSIAFFPHTSTGIADEPQIDTDLPCFQHKFSMVLSLALIYNVLLLPQEDTVTIEFSSDIVAPKKPRTS
jgi:hypothetical protein